MDAADPAEREPARESRLGEMRVWGLVFAGVFVALMVSVALQFSRGYSDARYVDLDESTLVDTASGTHLHLVLRHAPHHDQLAHEVQPPTEAEPLYTVVVRLSAEGTPAPYEASPDPDEEPDDRRILDIDLPRIDRVRILDLRWAREEVAVIEKRPPQDAGS